MEDPGNNVAATRKKGTTRKRKSWSQTKKQPLKVVYISNPMRVHTSASKFRALVQELTGRDAEFPDPDPDPAKFHLHAHHNTNKEEEEAFLDVDSNDDYFLEIFGTAPSFSDQSTAPEAAYTYPSESNPSHSRL